VEIEWARFYSREELACALEQGEISAPGRASIAYALLREWYGCDLPSGPEGTGRS
jgi:hydrolase, NUDIX family